MVVVKGGDQMVQVVGRFWWCIGDECKHCKTGVNDLLMYRRCKHPDILRQAEEQNKRVDSVHGALVTELNMCPVLTDVKL